MGKRNLNSCWLLAIGILSGLLGAAIVILYTSQPRGEAVVILPPPTPNPILVHVSGAVAHPNVYPLPPGCRVQEAIEEAGGLLPDAYTDSLNLATKLQDGDKVLVPFQPNKSPDLPPEKEEKPIEAEVRFPLNINTATLEELDLLPGIGAVKSQAIIDYRETNGPFVAIEQIQNISGIGPATFEKIKDMITVGANP